MYLGETAALAGAAEEWEVEGWDEEAEARAVS
jgi:hypothetical protein